MADATSGIREHPGSRATDEGAQVTSLRVTLLATNEPDALPRSGPWGFSALVEVDGRRILFDAGHLPDAVVNNARALGVDLSTVSDIILSHHHQDHVGGLMTLRRQAMSQGHDAMRRIHVAPGIFRSRRSGDQTTELNQMVGFRAAFEQTGGEFVVHDHTTELFPGVWLTGPVDRIHAERNWSGFDRVKDGDQWVNDTLPESQSLILNTEHGLVVLSGCGHAGIINTIAHARRHVRDTRVYAIIGGFHLFRADKDHLDWTGEQLQAAGVAHFLGAHCTGEGAVSHIRAQLGLDAANAVFGRVGSSFELGRETAAGIITR